MSDVCYVMFLEPGGKSNDPLDCALTSLIEVASPSPVMLHCELLLPPIPASEGNRTQFATYIGETAQWQSDRRSGKNYYLNTHGGSWRAVPVFVDSSLVRQEAASEVGTDYSLVRYITSTRLGRLVSGLLPSGRRAPAHCATLTARVLQNSGVRLSHNCNYYSPSTLYAELAARAAHAPRPMAVPAAAEVDSLVRSPETSISGMGDGIAAKAVHALTVRAVGAGHDATGEQIAQKQLASGLLRWVLFR